MSDTEKTLASEEMIQNAFKEPSESWQAYCDKIENQDYHIHSPEFLRQT